LKGFKEYFYPFIDFLLINRFEEEEKEEKDGMRCFLV
jgi:hypothetical protein